MAEVKPLWIFIAGLLLLLVFTATVVPRSPVRPWHPHGHHSGPWVLPGQAHLYGQEGFSSNSTFYMFGVDWCPHCTSTKPEFEALGPTQTIGGKSVSCVYVNPEKQPDLAAGFQIEGYPTLILQKGSSQIKYSGPRNQAGFLQFLQQNA